MNYYAAPAGLLGTVNRSRSVCTTRLEFFFGQEMYGEPSVVELVFAVLADSPMNHWLAWAEPTERLCHS